MVGAHLPESDDYETVAGFLMSSLGRVPQKGDDFEFEIYRFTWSRRTSGRSRRSACKLARAENGAAFQPTTSHAGARGPLDSYSNTSQIVTLFTRDQGLVSLLAKGSLRQSRRSSSFASPFDLAGWYDVVYRERSTELGLATEGRLIEGFDHLRRSYESYVEACFALEEALPEALSAARPSSSSYGERVLEAPRSGGGRAALRCHLVRRGAA